MPERDEIVVGRITGAHGIKGWVKVFSYTDPLEGILQYQPWTLVRDGQRRQVEVAGGNRSGRALVAGLTEVEDRNQAEKLAGWEIRVDRSQLPALESGELYWHQLEGLAVYNLAGERLGRIDSLIETGAHDVLLVVADEESIDERERMIPFVDKEVIATVDLDGGRVTVNWEADY